MKRLTKVLDKVTPVKALGTYLSVVRKWCPDDAVIHIDGSDIMKPDGYKFEALGIVRTTPEALTQKMFMKKATMCRKPVSWHKAITLSAFFQKRKVNF